MKLANKIQLELIDFCNSNRNEIVIPNFYVGNYEMDMFLLKNSGLVYEYEIKISRSDFKNDFKKHEPFTGILKHDELRKGKLTCNRFFFVVPEDLIKINEVPEYCGLIYYKNYGNYGYFNIVKNAKILHRNHYKDYEKLARKLAFREEILRYKIKLLKKIK